MAEPSSLLRCCAAAVRRKLVAGWKVYSSKPKGWMRGGERGSYSLGEMGRAMYLVGLKQVVWSSVDVLQGVACQRHMHSKTVLNLPAPALHTVTASNEHSPNASVSTNPALAPKSHLTGRAVNRLACRSSSIACLSFDSSVARVLSAAPYRRCPNSGSLPGGGEASLPKLLRRAIAGVPGTDLDTVGLSLLSSRPAQTSCSLRCGQAGPGVMLHPGALGLPPLFGDSNELRRNSQAVLLVAKAPGDSAKPGTTAGGEEARLTRRLLRSVMLGLNVHSCTSCCCSCSRSCCCRCLSTSLECTLR